MASAASSTPAAGEGLSLPASLHAASGPAISPGQRHVKGWATSFVNRHRSRFTHNAVAEPTGAGRSGQRTSHWWKVRLFRGMVNDIRRRAPFYWSDWADARDYRVIPATVYMYFAKYG